MPSGSRSWDPHAPRFSVPSLLLNGGGSGIWRRHATNCALFMQPSRWESSLRDDERAKLLREIGGPIPHSPPSFTSATSTFLRFPPPIRLLLRTPCCRSGLSCRAVHCRTPMDDLPASRPQQDWYSLWERRAPEDDSEDRRYAETLSGELRVTRVPVYDRADRPGPRRQSCLCPPGSPRAGAGSVAVPGGRGAVHIANDKTGPGVLALHLI